MTSVELEMYQSVPSVEFNTYWIPCTWFINLLKETKKGSRITDSHGLQVIMEVLPLLNAVNYPDFVPGQEIACFYQTWNIITVITDACH